MGAVPHRCAQAASDRSWPGLSPAVTSKAAADPHAVQCQQVMASTFPSRVLAAPQARPDIAARAASMASSGSDLPPVGGPGGRGIASRAISSARPLMTRCSLPQARHLTGRQGGPKDLFWQVDRPWRPSPQPPTLLEMGLAAWGQNGGAVMKPLLPGPLSHCCSQCLHAHRGHRRARPVDCRGRGGHRIGRYRPGEAECDGAPVTGGCPGSWASVVPGACR